MEALEWRNDCQWQVEVKKAGGECLAWDGKCKAGAKNFDTPFVLARHGACMLLAGYDAFIKKYSSTC